MKAPKKFWWKWHERQYGENKRWLNYFESSARTTDELEQELVDKHQLSRQAEGFRGIEAVKVKKPPLAVLCSKIAQAATEANEAHERFIELRDQKMAFYGLDKFPKIRRKKKETKHAS